MADGRALGPLPRSASRDDAPPRRGTAGLVMLAAMILSACFGGGGASVLAVPVASGLQPSIDGFAFPNFPSQSYDIDFGATGVVDMFGAGEAVCVGGVADPCVLTAEAAAFARLVNQARAAGHCDQRGLRRYV